MQESTVTDRLSFLAKQFDIFDCSTAEAIDGKVQGLSNEGNTTSLISTKDGDVLAIVSIKTNEKERSLKKISVCSDVFGAMIAADPTTNKMYLQWMLNLFTRFLKEGTEGIEVAIRLVTEDLPQANTYLQLFEDNKRKKKFSELCKTSYALKDVSDPTNINQYKSLAQLFDAVDPFIEKEPSAVERTLNKYVEMGQAIIPVKDRKFTLYIPKSTAASVIFDKFANWCTARQGNGMYSNYTENHKKPNGKNSDIYIIIDNKFFTGESQNLWQIHFETKQIKDRQNGANVSIYENVIAESEGIKNFFYDELKTMAKERKDRGYGIDNNLYVDFLVQFGSTESLFELYDINTPSIRLVRREIPKIPDLSRFKNLDELIVMNAMLVDLHPSIGKLTNLEYLILPNNRIKTLPKEIGSLRNVEFINLVGNPIAWFPEEMKYLDRSNGGKLERLGISAELIGEKNMSRLRELLPTTDFSENDK
jgi:hypothetical protein